MWPHRQMPTCLAPAATCLRSRNVQVAAATRLARAGKTLVVQFQATLTDGNSANQTKRHFFPSRESWFHFPFPPTSLNFRVVRLVLFDIDGTLIRTGGAGVKAFARTFATEFGLHDGVERLSFAGRTDTSLVREFFRLHEVDPHPDNFARFFHRYVFWLDHFLHRLNGRALPGVHELIATVRDLRSAPLLGLLTGNIQLGAEIKLRHLGLWEHFVCGAFGDDHEDRNQLAVIARERGGRLLDRKLRGEEILVIGDTPLDIACARGIDARCLAVATGGHTLAELQKHSPTWAVEDLREADAAEICK